MPTITAGTAVTDLSGFLTILDSLKTSPAPTVALNAGIASWTSGGITYTAEGTNLAVTAGALSGGTITSLSMSNASTAGFAITEIGLSVGELIGALFDANAGDAGALQSLLKSQLEDGVWTINGNDLANTATGASNLSSNITWNLGGGADVISAGLGVDVMNGGAGDDILAGGGNSDELNGEADNDSLSGGAGNDSLFGGTGNDTLDGGTGNDSLDGGANDDLIIISGAGTKSIAGGSGTDTVSLTTSFTTLRLESISGVENIGTTKATNSILGSALDDTVTVAGDIASVTKLNGVVLATGIALSGFKSFNWGQGNDTITGTTANELHNGGDGNDSLNGGGGNDNLIGGKGDDSLVGDAGNDTLDGGSGNDTIFGGEGDDLILISAKDREVINPSEPNVLDNVDDVIVGGGGDDTAKVTVAGLTVKLANLATAVEHLTTDLAGVVLQANDDIQNVTLTKNLAENVALSGFSNFDINGISTFAWGAGNDIVNDLDIDGAGNKHSGGKGDDTLTLNKGNDQGFGDAGNDTVNGGAGNDKLYGGIGDDRLNGGNDNDLIYGGVGNDVLNGDAGNDTFYVSSALGTPTINGGAGTLDVVEVSVARSIGLANLSGIEVLKATTAGVTLKGLDSADTFDLSKAAGSVGALAFSTQGISNFNWGKGDDVITGSFRGETFLGGAGDDILNGGSGSDRLQGGAGQDDLTGGSGADIFVFANGSELGSTAGSADKIEDFASGVDKINLQGLSLSWVAALSTGSQRQVTFDAASHQLWIDTDSDATPEFIIQLGDTANVVKNDLLL